MRVSTNYKALFFKAEEQRKQEAKLRKQVEERERQAREHNQLITFGEFIQYCHDLLWRPLRAEAPSRSTTGTIPPPTRKYCPLQLRPWTDCAARQQEIYTLVCHYLQPTEIDAPQLFTPLVALEHYSQQFTRQPISSKQDLETYKQLAMEDHVHDIITKLYKIPDTQEELQLGNRVWFNNHTNTLDKDIKPDASRSSTARPSRPDQFCIYQVNGSTSTLLTTVKYKPPHKLSIGSLQVVKPDTIPTEEPEKSELEFSYLTNSLVDMQLWVPLNDPGTLFYNLSEPYLDRTPIGGGLGHTSFDSVHAQIPTTDLQQNTLNIEHASSKYTSLEQTMATRSSTRCAPPSDAPPQEDSLDSDADYNTSTRQKQGISQVTLLPLGLQQGSIIDPLCPNANLHISNRQSDQHLVNAGTLVQMLKEQLNKDLDHNFTPIGLHGSFSALFKVTSITYRYTIISKATTSRRWKEVSQEADVYHILQRAQGLVIPVFLGVINLADVYFLHGARDIHHILLIG
ncbi:hypothetical protein BJY01DRAFT_234511 [Aspergillus pseudoustus]|uniref:Uncharacterized protein n=1 Tax=Aspergillus pseudoustus TaxID=1810923 RepID=A0ABR4K301_9EURO